MVQLGKMKIKELLDCSGTEIIIKYILKEIEHTWIRRFGDCTEYFNKEGVDQMILIIDLRGITTKDLTNKQINILFNTLLIEIKTFYPELLYKCFIFASMNFESHFTNEIEGLLEKSTIEKISITGESHIPQLLELVDPQKLPKEFGGKCECEATCIYSDKGPWADTENKINYANLNSNSKEEFKFQEDDEDNIDLLNNEEEDFSELKSAVQMSKSSDFNVLDFPSNLEMDCDSDDEPIRKKDKSKDDELKKAMMGLSLPGATPMNTQAEEEHT